MLRLTIGKYLDILDYYVNFPLFFFFSFLFFLWPSIRHVVWHIHCTNDMSFVVVFLARLGCKRVARPATLTRRNSAIPAAIFTDLRGVFHASQFPTYPCHQFVQNKLKSQALKIKRKPNFSKIRAFNSNEISDQKHRALNI